jgi:metallo-beta-lactamase family protein
VLSHAHIDHSGYLPLLVRRGFSGPIYCTPGTEALLRILLLDSAHLQEEEAAFANRHGYSKHTPAIPLYTAADAEAALRLTEPRPYGEPVAVAEGVTAILRRAGHILGSAIVDLRLGSASSGIVFSGDLGRWNRPILRDPELMDEADVLLVESTYGDRRHSADPAATLANVVRDAVERGGTLIVPAFAVGRTQELIWTLRQLEDAGAIPSIPVFVDSPMAINVTEIYCQYPEDHNLNMKLLMDEKRCPLCCKQYHLVRTAAESKALNDCDGPMIIISASGMATGGRVLHHLKFRLPDKRNTVLLPGFQAAGTRGRALQEGARQVRIHGESVPVCAKVVTLDGFSAHADRDDILRWLAGFRRPPKATYVVHGEMQGSRALAETLCTSLKWNARAAKDGETVPLVGGR